MTQQNKDLRSPYTLCYNVIIDDTMRHIDDLLKDKTLAEVACYLEVDPSTLRSWYEKTMTDVDTRNKFTTQLRVAIKVLRNPAQGTGARSLAQPVASAPPPRAAAGSAPRAAGSAPRAAAGSAPRAAGAPAPVASIRGVFEDTRKWVSYLRTLMGDDMDLVAETLKIDKKTLIKWASEKMDAHEQRSCTSFLRRKIKIFEDDRVSKGHASKELPFTGAAAAAGGAAAAEPDHHTLLQACNQLLVARVVELEQSNAELRRVNDGWLRVASDMMLHNMTLQETASPASTCTD